jgi:hypothetical protein
VAAEAPAPKAQERVTLSRSGRNRVDILLLEELAEKRAQAHRHDRGCAAVRFAFPAPVRPSAGR